MTTLGVRPCEGIGQTGPQARQCLVTSTDGRVVPPRVCIICDGVVSSLCLEWPGGKKEVVRVAWQPWQAWPQEHRMGMSGACRAWAWAWWATYRLSTGGVPPLYPLTPLCLSFVQCAPAFAFLSAWTV